MGFIHALIFRHNRTSQFNIADSSVGTVSQIRFGVIRKQPVDQRRDVVKLTRSVGWRTFLPRELPRFPQGGPVSPLLSNLVLVELRRELEHRGHRFVRYADDCAPRAQRAEEIPMCVTA